MKDYLRFQALVDRVRSLDMTKIETPKDLAAAVVDEFGDMKMEDLQLAVLAVTKPQGAA